MLTTIRPISPWICRALPWCQRIVFYQSTSAITVSEKTINDKVSEKYPSLDTKFDQYRIAYRYRDNLELLRGYFVYRLFSVNLLVNNQDKIVSMGRQVLGNRLFNKAFKLTTFGHFVGGENAEEIRPIIKRLLSFNVRPILDYSVESDDDAAPSTTTTAIDRLHDQNAEKFIECIQASRDVCGEQNLIAIKVTALVQPRTLKKFNTLLRTMKHRPPTLFELVDQQQTSDPNSTAVEQSRTPPPVPNEPNNAPSMSPEDWNEIHRLFLRLNRIAQVCVEKKIFIMVDAEQTYFQTAINYLTKELQRQYNKQSTAYIYGTYQCYLKDTLKVLKEDLAEAEKHDYIFAAKLVRGAYMEQERRLAREQGYEDPINPSFESTSQMYHTCLDEVFKSISRRNANQVKVMVASHNENTIRYAIDKMKENEIHRDTSTVSFASLYGMSDYVAFALANSGYKTYKYLPYGPVEALQPYLFRRAQENRSIFEKADKDRRLHFEAFKDRILHAKA